MRTKAIPAQITTVEDKIAGNLNLTQILLLMVPAFWTTIVFTVFTPTLKFAWYKLPLVVIVLLVSLILSFRIKGKLVLNWLVLLIRFNIRPKYYLFDKNDNYLRAIPEEKKQKPSVKKHYAKQNEAVKESSFALGDLIRLENLIANPKYSFSLKSQRKGGLYVAFEQNKK